MFFKLISALSRLILKLGGWTLEGSRPPADKYIMLASPHTSFVDGFLMVLAGFGLGIRPSYLVKAAYTKGFFGQFTLWSGGIPVLSGAGANKVKEVIEIVNKAEKIELLVAPAGTRAKRDSWRSGFFHIARGANLPIYLSYLDFGKRCAGVDSRPIHLSGDTSKDMDMIRAFYAGMQGKHPEQMTPIYIKEEES